MCSTVYCMILIGLILVSQVGCGTLHNLHAPPDKPVGFDGSIGSGSGICIPFGGAARSGLMGIVYTPGGISEVINGNVDIIQGGSASDGITRIGNGVVTTGTGVVALMDTPLSLAGDVVTLPIVIARQQKQPWATWWGTGRDACWFRNLSWFRRTSDETSHTQKENVQQD